VVQGRDLTLSPFSPVILIPPTTTTFEAESAILGGEAKLQACSACSGGQRVGFLGTVTTNGVMASGTLTVTNVNVPAPGSYVVSLFYTSQDDRTGTLTVNGVPGSPIAFLSSGNFDTVARLDAVVSLNAGANTIAIGNNTSRAPSIDRLVVNIQ
jgi:Carbohydrate binding module (family 35)